MGVKIYDSSGRLKTNSVTTIDNNQLGHPGFRTDQTTNGFYLGFTSNGNDSGQAHDADIVYQLWYIPYTLTIAQYGINGDDSGNTGTLKIGMYNNLNGLPTSLVTGTSASITGNGTGDSTVAFASKPTLTAGWYWLASVITSGAIDIEHSTGGGVNNNKAFYSQPIANYGQDWACYEESGSDLPNSANPGDYATLSYTPRIGIRFDTE